MQEQARLMAAYLGIGHASREAAILRLLVDVAVKAVDADEGSLLAHDEGEKCLRFLMTSGGQESEQALLGQRVPLGQGVTGLAAQTMSVQTGSPVYTDIRQAKRIEQGGEADPEAVMAAPMVLEERLMGVLTTVSFVRGKLFSARDMDILGAMAAVAAVVVDQSRRLAMLGQADEAAETAGGEPGLEERVVRSAARIAGQDPESLARVASLMEAVESLVVKPGEGK